MKQKINQILEKQMLYKADLKILESYEPNDSQNLFYSFFTPIWLCEVMYKLAVRYGYKNRVP